MPNDIFNQIFRTTIGFDPLQRFVDTVDFSNYPPFNIEKTLDANIYALTIAVAGFSKDDIEVFVEDGQLVVKAEKASEDTDTEYLYRGLSLRNFKRYFKLGSNILVNSVSLKDGLLVVVLREEIPEAKRTKFDIS